MFAESRPSRVKLDSVAPTYHDSDCPVLMFVMPLVLMLALVEISAVLVRETFHEVVEALVLSKTCCCGSAVNFTPGAVTSTSMSCRLLFSRISSMSSSGSMMKERVVSPEVCGVQYQIWVLVEPAPTSMFLLSMSASSTRNSMSKKSARTLPTLNTFVVS